MLSDHLARANAHILAATQGQTSRGFEDEILRMEGLIPGLGGVFLDSTGHVVVYLKDLTTRDAALAQLRERAQVINVDRGFRNKLGVDGPTVTRQGSFAFSDLVAWEEEIMHNVRVAGFLSIDADESLNRVRITTAAGTSTADAAKAIASLGIPDSAVVFEVGSQFTSAASLTDKVRATGGGLTITNKSGDICTLGFNVDVEFYGSKGFLTAGHCSSNGPGGGFTGDSMYQNTKSLANLVGTVSINPLWNSTDSNCGVYTDCTGADAMFVLSTFTDTNFKKQWFSTSMWATGSNAPGSLTINGQWNTDTVQTLIYTGATLYKVGQTTGVTYGTVAGTCENALITPVDYMVLCADRVTGATAGFGDSGAPVFYPADTATTPHQGPYVMGMLFASNTPNTTPPTPYCKVSCAYYFSEWGAIQSWLARYFLP
jgi:hypothetical protein